MMIDAKNLIEMSNAVRATALRALRHAKSGHIGIALGAADIITMIYAVFLNPARDRFVLSAGHGSALLYAILKLAGYRVGDLDSLRRLDGLPGHPEFGIDGVSATTGPLGQGVANAVGMAIAEKHFNSDGRIYCMASDGDLMEGVANEAISFAGRYKLNNLVLLWDNNGVSIDGAAQTDINMAARMRAAGWDVRIANGHDFDEMYDAVSAESNGPVFVQCNTVIGIGSSAAGGSRAHGFDLSDAEIASLIEDLDSVRGRELWGMIARTHATPRPRKYAVAPNPLLPDVPHFASTREMSGVYLSRIMSRAKNIICGSADLGHSTNVRVDGTVPITSNDFSGNYINYGVREHAMAAIMNGMAYSGLRAVGSTFLVFSDYMRGAMRLAALAGLPVVYVLTHDSIAVGPDGPTHQPVEQLISLRCIPNLDVYRPADINETLGAYRNILEERRPSVVVLGRNKVDILDTTSINDIRYGAYIIEKEQKDLEGIIISTGEEIELAKKVWKNLNDKGIGIRLVSMPSMECFERQDDNYQESVLPSNIKKFVIEASSSYSWYKYTSKEYMFTVDNFGKSGKRCDVLHEYGFLEKDIELKIEELLK